MWGPYQTGKDGAGVIMQGDERQSGHHNVGRIPDRKRVDIIM